MADLTPLLTETPTHRPVLLFRDPTAEPPEAGAHAPDLSHDAHYALHEAECLAGMPGGTPQGTLGHTFDYWRAVQMPVTGDGAVEVTPFIATCTECGAVAMVLHHHVTAVGRASGLHPLTPGFFGTAFITRCEWSE